LSEFYGTGLDKDWRFGESEGYLRELGVLDESSPWKGKQVIVPNYLQAASNCIVAAPHYLVCCQNECEHLLGEIEGAIQHPTATVEQLLSVVRNISSPSSKNDQPPILKGALTEQLRRVAEAHGGEVPLHGRLFSQWMHYAFPRECPFPHKAGAYSQHTLTPGAFGGGYIASKDEMREHVSQTEHAPGISSTEDWMSQWSSEEELFADYTAKLRAPWERSGISMGALVMFVALGVVIAGIPGRSSAKSGSALPTFASQKFHLV